MSGAWRFDPFKRIQVWVGDVPRLTDDVLSEYGYEKPKYVAKKPTTDPLTRHSRPRKKTKACADCPTLIDNRSKRCPDCHTKLRNVTRSRLPVAETRGLHDPIDELKVQLLLDGQFAKCTRPERLEVLARWTALGRSDQALIDLTGWNVPRDRRYIRSIQTKEAA